MSGRFLRENAFLVAAVALPFLVVAVFLLATAIPRWRVPPPAYDALVRTTSYDPASPRFVLDFTIRDGRLHATLRPIANQASPQRSTLWLFDHHTRSLRRVPVDPPDGVTDAELPVTFPVHALLERRVLTATTAPDGYEVRHDGSRGSGLAGELLGMGGRRRALSLVNRGRVVTVDLPNPYEHHAPEFVGWLGGGETH